MDSSRNKLKQLLAKFIIITSTKQKWQWPKLPSAKFIGVLKTIKPDLKKELDFIGKKGKCKTEIAHYKFVFD